MSISYTVLIMSAEQAGFTGDNGENWMAFFQDIETGLNTFWAWFNTEKEAQDYARHVEDDLKNVF